MPLESRIYYDFGFMCLTTTDHRTKQNTDTNTKAIADTDT